MTVLVGGVGQLYQGDLDLGRLASERLAHANLGQHVLVEELHYGAVAVAQRLQELTVGALVIVGAAERGDPAGTVRRRRHHPIDRPVADLTESVRDAVTGYVTIDLLVDVASALDALPARTVAIEIEPAWTHPSPSMSPTCAAALDVAVRRVHREIHRLPLLELGDQLHALLSGGRLEQAPALDTARALLDELHGLDETGHWGATFALRDRLRERMARGDTPHGMDHVDWALWWALIEELDRSQAREVVG